MNAADLVHPLDGNTFDWPLFGLQSDIRPALARAAAARTPAALATLYKVNGGTPLGLGAQMVLVDEMLTGFLSGGCIEADVALHAYDVLTKGHPKRLVYGEGGPWDIQLPCGSHIEILVERVTPDSRALQELLELTRVRRPALWLTDGDQQSTLPLRANMRLPAPFKPRAGPDPQDEICAHNAEPFAIFRAYAPPTRLIVVGHDPIAMAVLKLAIEMDLETILIRPRGPKTCPLPVKYFAGEIDEAMAAIDVDAWTAIAVLSHDSEVEHQALTCALSTPAGYIGALGSRRRMPARRLRLQSAGFDEHDLQRIHAPIGLQLDGHTPWSIALSIVAEVVGELAPQAAARDKRELSTQPAMPGQ